MAKTKRRQLAALAAQAELKELVGTNERTSSCHKSGPSGTIPQPGDPNVEIRTQRVIFKIPALPPKSPSDTQPLKIATKEVLGKRRRRKGLMDTDLSSEQVPADEAKISKGIVQFGKWKRHKKIRDLLPDGERAVPTSAGLSNGDQPSPVAKSTANDKLQNGELLLSVGGSQRQPKKRVNFMTGSRKRAKLQDVVVRLPSEKESKSMENQGKSKAIVGYQKRAKPHEVLVRSPAKRDHKLLETQGKSKAIIRSQRLAKPQEVVVKSPARRRSKLMETQGKSNASIGSQKRAKPQDVVVVRSLADMEGKSMQTSRTSKVTVSSRKRAKPQEVVVRSQAERESKLMAAQSKSKAVIGSQKRVKLHEAVLRSPPGKGIKLLGTRGKSKKAVESALDKAEGPNRRSRDLLVKGNNRSQELAKASNEDSPSTLSLPPASRKRRRGDFQKVMALVPASPKPIVVSPHRTRSRAKISYCEAMALEVLQEIQNVKNLSQQMENRGKIAANDTMKVRSIADGEAMYCTRDQTQEQPQNCGNFTSPLVQGKKQLARVGVTADSLSHFQNGPPTSYYTCSRGDASGDMKSRFRMKEQSRPFAHGEQRVFQVVPLQEKDPAKSTYHSGANCSTLREAEIIKQDSQLTIMDKRLKTAGGLRNWLLDKGLERFLPILENWNIDNLSLRQLTMEGLKSMGFLPVGPRRKLIHAISCLTVPSSTTVSLVAAKTS